MSIDPGGRRASARLAACLYALAVATGVVARVPPVRAQPAPPDGRLPTLLGANYAPAATSFSIWSPDTDDVKLFLEGQPALLAMLQSMSSTAPPGQLHRTLSTSFRLRK
jgi:hypothetical protein